MRGGSTSPEGGAVLHHGVDKSFVPSQKLRCAKEGLCMTEDAQPATGFGGHFENVAFPGKIMAESETQKVESETRRVEISMKGHMLAVTGEKVCEP